jgi:hypothetical protein
LQTHFVTLLVLIPLCFAAHGDAVKTGLAKLDGTWLVVGHETNGKPTNEEHWRKVQFGFKGAQLTFRQGAGLAQGKCYCTQQLPVGHTRSCPSPRVNGPPRRSGSEGEISVVGAENEGVRSAEAGPEQKSVHRSASDSRHPERLEQYEAPRKVPGHRRKVGIP